MGVARPEPTAAAPFAYVPNLGDRTVSVLDAATNRVVSAVPVGVAPTDAVVAPDGTRVFVLNAGDFTAAIPGSVSVIDTATHAVIATVPLTTFPGGGGIAATLHHVYVNTGGDSIAIIDPATNTISDTVTVGCNAIGVAVDRNDSHVYVSECSPMHGCGTCPNAPGDVAVIDTATKAVAHVPVGVFPTGIAVSPDATRVYVKEDCPAPGNICNVAIIDTATNTVAGTVPMVGTTTGEIAVDPTGARLYVTDGIDLSAGSVLVVDTAAKAVTKTIAVGRSPIGVAVTPAGTAVYVLNRDDNDVSVIDPKSDTVTTTVAVGTLPVATAAFIGPEDAGLVPSDTSALRCENRFAGAARALVAAILKCHVKAARKAFRSKAFDEDACEGRARTAYDATKFTGCPLCVGSNAPALRDLLESVLERANGKLYCAGTQPFAP